MHAISDILAARGMGNRFSAQEKNDLKFQLDRLVVVQRLYTADPMLSEARALRTAVEQIARVAWGLDIFDDR